MKIDVEKLIYSGITILLGILIYEIITLAINKLFLKTTYKLKTHQLKRLNTIKTLLFNIIKYILFSIILIIILAKYGINVSSLVTGLGITTAIIGLAFQDFAKDIIAGFSIIMENQYEVGDTIEVNGFMGEVIFIGLKNTKIRNYKGATYIIANRNMDKVINYSLHNSLAVVDINADYKYNPDEIIKVLEEFKKEYKDKIPNATGELNILGVNSLNSSDVTYTITIETEKMKHFETQRYLKKELKKYFDKNKIKIPFPQIEVTNGK